MKDEEENPKRREVFLSFLQVSISIRKFVTVEAFNIINTLAEVIRHPKKNAQLNQF